MANFIPKIGLHNNLPTQQEGSLLITTDNKEIYVDTSTGRQLISDGRREIEYIEGTQTGDTNVWTGISTDKTLYTGKVIAYKLPHDGTTAAASLTLTLANGSTTNAIQLRRQNNIVTKHYPAGSVILLIYDGTYWRTDGDYNSEPVSSVNTKTGHVILTASDVGALPDDTAIPSKTSDLTNDSGFITQADVQHITYTGANGIELTSANVIQHTNNITPVTTYPDTTSSNSSFVLRDIQYDEQGHITNSQTRTIQLIQSLDELDGISTIDTGNIEAPLNLSTSQSGTTVTINGSISTASTTMLGVTRLSTATNSTATDLAATPSAVKAVYDLANNYRGTITSIVPGNGLVNAATGDGTAITSTGTISLATVTTSATSNTTAPTAQGTFTVIDDIDTNSFGQITNINTKTVTLPKDTTYVFDGTYNSATNKAATVATVTSAINALNVNAITGAASKTITSISETSGKISATYADIAIDGAQITELTIPNNRLENSSISIAGSSVALGGSISTETLRTNLGISQALSFKGITSAGIADGNNVIPTDLGIANYSPTIGDVVIDSNTSNEYVWIKGDGFLTGRWELLGSESSFKLLQTAIASPTASGTSIQFIDTISQDTNGVISATKKTVASATTTGAGLMTSSMVTKLEGIANNATANSGTVRSITLTAGTGIALNSTAAITDTGTRTISLDTTGTSGTYGETTQQTPAHDGTFNIPYITVDAYGRVTSAGTTTVKLPSDKQGVTSVTLTAGTGIAVSSSAAITSTGARTISLAALTSTGNTSATSSPGFGETFEAINSVSYDSYGRVSGTVVATITIPNEPASTTINGLMTSSMVSQINSMKSKLDNIDANANNYSLPTASTDTKGGIKVGTGLTMSGEILNHSNSITSGTISGGSGTLSFGGTITVPSITYDSEGHITSTDTTTYTLPNTPTNSRDPGYGKIAIGTASTSTAAITPTSGTTTARTYNEQIHFDPGNKWIEMAATNSSTTGADTITIAHAISGATAGNYGDNVSQTPNYGDSFSVPYIVVDEGGHITSISSHTVTIPAAINVEDTKVTQAAAITTNGDYPIILAYSTATTAITNTVNKTSTLKYNPNSKILSITGGTVSATTFSGTATKVGHKLTIGTYEFDGSADVSIPIYGGEISNTVNYINGDTLAYGGT